MRYLFLIATLLSFDVFAQTPTTCGPITPATSPGCTLQCVNGAWQRTCSPTEQCGPKPLAAPGCTITNCVGNQWQQSCPGTPSSSSSTGNNDSDGYSDGSSTYDDYGQ